MSKKVLVLAGVGVLLLIIAYFIWKNDRDNEPEVEEIIIDEPEKDEKNTTEPGQTEPAEK